MALRKHVIEDYREMVTMLIRKSSAPGFVRHCVAAVLLSCLGATAAMAQDTVCAKVKIEIKQELTLERQAFDAEMKINNTTDTGVIENVSVVVKVTDENGVPVRVSSDPNDLTAKFFIRLSSKENISDVDGTGVVNPKTSSIIDWLLIPAPGAAGSNPLGKKYLVGATLKYKFGGEDSVLDVSPDVITVKPLPQLTLDYFLTRDVQADDPLTTEIEPAQPFTLGVRVKNNGIAIAKNLKIDSAQPKIVDNSQGLLINFTLTGSYVDDAPVQNSLLINFGDIAASTSKTGRWTMETTLAGKFTEFTARFTHADELGGALTSLLQATNAHLLLHDVRVDLPGRDFVRDFLALDGDVLRVYESDSTDTEVTDRSAAATLAGSGDSYRLNFPATAGFAYVKLRDPYNGAKTLGTILRSDGKQVAPENVWLSRTRNEQSKQWEYWFNLFDVNTTGVYDTAFTAPPTGAHAPVLQFIAGEHQRRPPAGRRDPDPGAGIKRPDARGVRLDAAERQRRQLPDPLHRQRRRLERGAHGHHHGPEDLAAVGPGHADHRGAAGGRHPVRGPSYAVGPDRDRRRRPDDPGPVRAVRRRSRYPAGGQRRGRQGRGRP
jgi:hypothetical protein